MPADDGDVRALLHESERMTAAIGARVGLPSVQRSMSELLSASRTLVQAVPENVGNELAARRMLAQQNFNAEDLNRSVQHMDLQAREVMSKELGDTDIPGYLKHHYDMIVITAVDEAAKSALEDAESVQSSWMNAEWGDQRQGNKKSLEQQRPMSAPMSPMSPMLALGPAQGAAAALPPQAKIDGYTDMVASMRDAGQAARPFTNFFEFEAAQGTDPKAMELWNLMRHTCLEHRDGSGGGGGGRVFLASKTNPNEASRSECQLSLGALDFLEEQYMRFLQRHTDNGVEHNYLQPSAAGGFIDRVKGYVTLLKTNGGLPEASRTAQECNGVPLFPVLYFALRCGQLGAAKKVLEEATMASVPDLPPSLAPCLDAALALRRSRRCFAEGTEAADALDQAAALQAHSAAAKALSSLYDKYAKESASCPYRLHVINLITASNVGDMNRAVVHTIEDFLWTNLWFNVASGRGSGAASLAARISKLGPRHFDPAGNNPVAAASVFCLVQDFGKAVNYLCAQNKIHEALHLAIGLATRDLLPCETNDASTAKAVEANYLELHDKASGGPAPTVCFSLLMDEYLTPLMAANPGLALHYVMMLKAPQSQAQRDRLLLKVVLAANHDRYVTLLGALSEDGRLSSRGIIHDVLPDAKIRELCSLAAERSRSSGAADDAIELFFRAHNFVAVVDVFVDELARCIEPDSDTRTVVLSWWRDRAVQFSSKYLNDSRQSNFVFNEVARQSQNRRNAVADLGDMLVLHDFFDAMKGYNYEAALKLVDRVDMLPQSAGDIQDSIRKALGMNDILRNNFHHILVKAMECLQQLHQILKGQALTTKMHDMNNVAGRIDTVTEELAKFRIRAKTLVSFAGQLSNHVKLPSDTMAKLTALEITMI